MDKPQPLLAEGQRNTLRPCLHFYGGQQQSLLLGLQTGSQCSNGGVAEQVLDGHFCQQLFAHGGYQSHGQQRVSTQRKEILLYADAFDAEQFLPDGCQCFFRVCAWSYIHLGRQVSASRFGQCFPVYFPVWC